MSASPKPMRIVPESLLMMVIFLKFRRSLNFPAIATLAISAAILTARQIEKIMILCLQVWVAAKAVALINQKNMTLGFKVLIAKPEAQSLAKSRFLKRVVMPVVSVR